MRVLITGMGGELGTRVANLLEEDESVTEILGIDLFPPRRRIFRSEFHRVEPTDRRKAVHLVRDFDPEVILHLGVFEPHSRTNPTEAQRSTAASAVSVLGAAAKCPSLTSIVVRSGVEAYGRRRGAPTRPDEGAALDPTSPFGASLAHVEQVANEAGDVAGVPVTSLRLAPIVGPSIPSPLGRYLRLPAVAVDPLSEMPFSLLHQEDACQAMVAAAWARHDGPLNVVGAGAVTATQAVLMGRRIPVPVFGPGWLAAAAVAEMQGAPLPAHAREILVRGCTADGALARSVLGIEPRSTHDVVSQLYRWDTVAHPEPSDQAARR
ncbi:NAD-dependent epimerase/dehydratase family protein [Aquihabitans sp. McL0605]|uniref:NAD-dependent epimerase/dehydratase family protein n=1 Tax=Aquihabitans sp. McL0605 TaxID=3415671 RepID=UPI003CF560F2